MKSEAVVAAQEGAHAEQSFAQLSSAARSDGLSLVPLADFPAVGGEGGAVGGVQTKEGGGRDETDAWGSGGSPGPLISQPSTPNPRSYTLDPYPSTPEPQTLYPIPHTLYPYP